MVAWVFLIHFNFFLNYQKSFTCGVGFCLLFIERGSGGVGGGWGWVGMVLSVFKTQVVMVVVLGGGGVLKGGWSIES